MDGFNTSSNFNPMIREFGFPLESPEEITSDRDIPQKKAVKGLFNPISRISTSFVRSLADIAAMKDGGTDESRANDPISKISASFVRSLTDIAAMNDECPDTSRANYIRPPDHAFFQNNRNGGNSGASSETPSGEGGEGGNGSGEGGGGGGKKEDFDDVMSFSLDNDDTSESSDEKEDGDGTDPEDSEKYNYVDDTKLAAWAKKHGIDFVKPTGYEANHYAFVGKKFSNHATRMSKIEEVRERLNDHITAIRMFKVNVKSALSRATRESFEDETKSSLNEDGMISLSKKQRRKFAKVLNRAFEMMKGSMPKSSRALILNELEEISKMVEDLPKSYSRQKEMRIMDAASLMEGVFRYKMEGREGTYRSINLTPETLAQLCGVPVVDGILFKDERTLNRIVDYGSGDGETLIQLASRIPYALAMKGVQMCEAIVRQVILNEYGDNIPSYYVGVEIERRAIPMVEKWKTGIFKQIKNRLICVDQASHFIERLKNRKGLGGVTADLCLPTRDFLETTGIAPGSVDIGISSLTIDRARDIAQLFANISATLAENGTLVLLTKSTHAAQSDGSAAADSFSQIEYGQSGLKAKDRFQLLELLQGMLEKEGLIIVKVGRHPGKVISTDISDNNVQSYNLLALVCKKIQNEDCADRSDKPETEK